MIRKVVLSKRTSGKGEKMFRVVSKIVFIYIRLLHERLGHRISSNKDYYTETLRSNMIQFYLV